MGTDRRGRAERAGTEDGESFVGRWSRRKRAARTEEQAPLVPPGSEASERGPSAPGSPGSAVSGPVEPSAAGAAEPVLTDADMPPLETLDAESDWSGFMSAGVSPELRKAALRKLFHLPQFNIRDGLNDYDEDYTSFEALGDVVTSDMHHQIEREEAKVRADAEPSRSSHAEAEQSGMEQSGAEQSGAEPIEAGEVAAEEIEAQQSEVAQIGAAETEAEPRTPGSEATADASASTAQASDGTSQPRVTQAPAGVTPGAAAKNRSAEEPRG